MLSIWTGIEEGANLGDSILLKIDIEKAYDKLEWRFMLECLKAMNFGPEITGWIRALMKKATTVVQVNGEFWIINLISRSVRQGCPLAPLLFDVATEPFIRGILKASVPR